MGISRLFSSITGIMAVAMASIVFAGTGDHAMHDMNVSAKNGMFERQQDIDGYRVTFQIAPAQPGKEMGGSHDVMVRIEKDGKAVTEARINSKVIHPNDKSETRMMMAMGDWYMAGYDLGHEGRHQVMILFKTADGSKHQGGVYYPDN